MTGSLIAMTNAMSPDRSRETSNRGFTLVELLVAIVILTLSASALALLSSTTSTANYRSQDEATATALAIQKIEQLKATPFSSIDSTTCQNPESGTLDQSGASGGIFTRSCTGYTAVTVNGASTKNLTVSVSWTGGGTVTLTTTIADVPLLATGYSTAYLQSWSQTQ